MPLRDKITKRNINIVHIVHKVNILILILSNQLVSGICKNSHIHDTFTEVDTFNDEPFNTYINSHVSNKGVCGERSNKKRIIVTGDSMYNGIAK